MQRVKPSRYFATNGMGLTSSPFHNNKLLPFPFIFMRLKN